jgi:hypothetical protein
VITYDDAGLRVAESYWDQTTGAPAVDLVRLFYRSDATAGDRVLPCPTLRVSVRVVENPLRGPLEQLTYVLELDAARRAQRGMNLHIRCGVHFHPPRLDLEQFLRFAADEVRWEACSPSGMARLVALSEAGALRLSTASDERGRVLAQHCYVCVGDRARLLDGAFGRAADDGPPEEAETIDCADPCLLYCDIVTLHDFDVETLDLPILDVARPGVGLRGKTVTLYNTERALSTAGRRALATRGRWPRREN